MKKKSLFLFTLIPLLAGCNSGNSGPISPIPYVEPEPEVKTDVVYIGFSDSKNYTPSDKVTFTVTVEDTSIVTYDSIYLKFTSGTKEGTTLAHFVSPKLTYHVTVTVQDDGTAPLFQLDESNIRMNANDAYKVNASLSFRGVDGFAASSGLHYVKVDEDEAVTSLSINGKEISITANAIGVDTYTIYTEYAGLTLSKNLVIEVVQNKAFVVIGSRLTFTDKGATYNIPMYKYSENPINLSTDLSVSKGGVTVKYSDLTISADTSDVISIVNNQIVVNGSGTANIIVKYQNDEQNIFVNVYKPFIDEKKITLADNRFALNLGLTILNSTRVYSASKNVTKSFVIDKGSYSFINPYSVSVNGKERKNNADQPITLSGNNITLTAASFDIDCAGEKEVTLAMEGTDYLVSYVFEMLFITKELSVKADLDTYLVIKYPNDVIYGYYTLKNDIDCYNYALGQSYFSGMDKTYLGFRGVLDGSKVGGTGNYAIKNLLASMYGLTTTVGEGGVMKNIIFDNIILNNTNKTAVFGSFVFGATFENIVIKPSDSSNLSSKGPDSDPCASGVLASQKMLDSYVNNLTIDAKGHTIKSLIGKTASNNKFADTLINCVDIIYYCTSTIFDPVTLEPTSGVKFKDTKIEGITIVRNK